MAFKNFGSTVRNAASKAVKVVKGKGRKAAPVAEPATTEKSSYRTETFAAIEPTGGANGKSGSLILHFGVLATETFGLRPGMQMKIAYDADTKQIGVRPCRTNETGHPLAQHGGKDTRVKMSITNFYREHLEGLNLNLPAKMIVTKGKQGFLVMEPLKAQSPNPRTPSKPVAKGKTAKASPVKGKTVPVKPVVAKGKTVKASPAKGKIVPVKSRGRARASA